MSHGGKRKGSGRKPEHGEAKITTTVAITPEVKDFLDQYAESRSGSVEQITRESKAFRDWRKQKTVKDSQPKRWTADEIASMERMLADGQKQIEVARKLGRSVAAIQHQVNKRGLAKSSHATVAWTDAEDETLIALLRSGLKQRDAAVKMTRSLDSVAKRVQALHLAGKLEPLKRGRPRK